MIAHKPLLYIPLLWVDASPGWDFKLPPLLPKRRNDLFTPVRGVVSLSNVLLSWFHLPGHTAFFCWNVVKSSIIRLFSPDCTGHDFINGFTTRRTEDKTLHRIRGTLCQLTERSGTVFTAVGNWINPLLFVFLPVINQVNHSWLGVWRIALPLRAVKHVVQGNYRLQAPGGTRGDALYRCLSSGQRQVRARWETSEAS